MTSGRRSSMASGTPTGGAGGIATKSVRVAISAPGS
jgi:hypothetical protein